MVVRTDTFDRGLKDTLDEVLNDKLMATEQYKAVFNMKDSNDAYEEDEKIQYSDEMEQVDEGGAYPRDDIEPIWVKRYTHLTYKKEIVITKEALKDHKYNKMIDAVASLGESANLTLERLGASFFINGFTTELAPGPNNEPVFYNHSLISPLPGNPTVFNNVFALPLNPTNLKTVFTSMVTTVNEHGSLCGGMPDQLIVCPQLIWMANQIIESELENETSDNNKNVLKGKLKVIPLNFLAEATQHSTEMWFLRDSTRAKNKWYVRQSIEKNVVRDPSTGNWLYQVDMRHSRGCSDYRGLAGSTGS